MILIYKSVFGRFILGAVFMLAFSTMSQAGDLKGKVCITGGDTLKVNSIRRGRHCVGGTKVRLLGIDAPELKQQCRHSSGRNFLCGRKAASYLFELTKGKVVICEGDTRDGNERVLGTCFVGKMNLNQRMVQLGWAVAYRDYSKDYIKDEERAKSARRGIWDMKFMMPWDWRRKR